MHNSGLQIRRLSGLELKPSHWDSFYQFYMNTCNNKWGRPYLTRDFFHEISYSMADHVLLAVAQEGDKDSPLVAAALNMVKSIRQTLNALALICKMLASIVHNCQSCEHIKS